MNKHVYIYTGLLGTALIIGAFGGLISNSYQLSGNTHFLRNLGLAERISGAEIHPRLRQLAIDRFFVYESQIQRRHLLDGMVVNKTSSNQIKDQCDSLLFSSLRYVALSKMRQDVLAADAWRAIERSQIDGEWHRHPRCRQQPTSRDMIVGLMAAITQQPPRYQQHLRDLVTYVESRDGFIGEGPFYVSWLTPGVADTIRMVAQVSQVPAVQSSAFFRRGFSTAEFSVPLLERGYESHLVALSLWIEMEISGWSPSSSAMAQPQSLLKQLAGLTNIFTVDDIATQRRDWISQQLMALDPNNLFFRWLRYRAADALSVTVREELLTSLLGMSQFPTDDLPGNCNRRADYLWQRDSRQYNQNAPRCTVQYSGVDYQWMAALLLEENDASVILDAH